MSDILIEARALSPGSRREIEIVERKGLGHPDSICDALMEAVSIELCREYLQTCGRVLHHNLDKALLVAGQTTPALGGGTVGAPMRLVVGDRATDTWNGVKLPIREIVAATVTEWFRKNLRYVDPQQHLVLQNELHPGSAELVDLFSRERLTANDTSAAVGYAPLSETEQLVLAAERYLNSQEFKLRHPETGEDVKVMGVRRGRDLHLTVAMAFVDRFIVDARSYFEIKAAVEHELAGYLETQLNQLDRITVILNSLDDPHRGLGGMYLTVLGTSAEGADGGEVGRGNRVNGLISFHRPMTLEAAAGKNPVSHVGKIYNLLSHQLARRIQSNVPGISEVYLWICSRIGQPLDEPWSVAAELSLEPSVHLQDIEHSVRKIIEEELQAVDRFVERLCRGDLPVC